MGGVSDSEAVPEPRSTHGKHPNNANAAFVRLGGGGCGRHLHSQYSLSPSVPGGRVWLVDLRLIPWFSTRFVSEEEECK